MSGFYIVDLTLPANEMVLGLINNDNDLDLTFSTVTFGDVSTNTDLSHDRNTTMVLQNGKYARDTLQVYYDRLQLEDIIDATWPIILTGVTDGNVSDLLSFINSDYGLGLVPADIVDAALGLADNDVVSSALTIADGNYAWLGETPVVVLTDGYSVAASEADLNTLLVLDDDSYIVLGTPAWVIAESVTLADGESVLTDAAIEPITATDGSYFILHS